MHSPLQTPIIVRGVCDPGKPRVLQWPASSAYHVPAPQFWLNYPIFSSDLFALFVVRAEAGTQASSAFFAWRCKGRVCVWIERGVWASDEMERSQGTPVQAEVASLTALHRIVHGFGQVPLPCPGFWSGVRGIRLGRLGRLYRSERQEDDNISHFPWY